MEGDYIIPIAWWVFDVIIAFTLIGGGAVLIELFAKRKARSYWLTWVLGAVVALAWVAVFYGSFLEPHTLTVAEHDIDLTDGETQGSARVIFLSDIHVGPYKHQAWVRRVAEAINDIEADMVLIAGDFVSNNTTEVEQLTPLQGVEHDVWAILGNHDFEGHKDPDAIAEKLQSFDVNLIRNTSVLIEGDGYEFNLVGVDDLWFSADVNGALDIADPELMTIMLVHNPDFILEERAHEADLVLSGHTHGGQIRLPGWGPVPPLPTKLGRVYDRGLFGFGNHNLLFITQGVGETGPRARLFAPPTIDILNISY